MDDTTASLKNETSALQLYQEMVTLLEQAGMHFHKRTLFNSNTVLQALSKEPRKMRCDIGDEFLHAVKTLGVVLEAETNLLVFSG